MKRSLLLLTLVISPCFLFAQNVTFYFTNAYNMPVNDGIWKDTSIIINAVVYAPGPVATVTAAAGGRQIGLVKDGSPGGYRGVLSLQGLPGDTLTLVVSATDSLGNSGDTATRFIYRPLNDPGVVLTIDSLADQSVARPFLRLRAKSPGSTIQVFQGPSYNMFLVATAKDSLPEVDLSNYDGQQPQLTVIATDTLGRTARIPLTAFVESSPYLTPFYLSNENVRDIRYNKALIAEKGTGYPVLVDISSGQRSAPLVSSAMSAGLVTPEGAIFFADSGTSLYEWKNGQIVYTSGSGNNLKVAGQHAAWLKRNNDTLMYRNLATGVTDSIGITSYGGDMDLGANGVVVFNVHPDRYNAHLYKYDSGRVTMLSQSQGNQLKGGQLTDGINVIYTQGGYLDERYTYFYNGASKTDALLVSANLAPYLGYQINSNYAAFLRATITIRDSLGNTRTASGLPRGPIEIDLLNNKGELIVASPDSGRYFINSIGQAQRIGAIPVTDGGIRITTTFYDGHNWYLKIGRTSLKVNVDSVPVNHISNFEKTGKPDSVIRFTRKDFAEHFSGPGELMAVRFTALPKHGVLKAGSWQFPVNTAIGSSSMGSLSYTPDSAYTGADTIRWIASNGLTYTSDTAYILIDIKDSTVTVPQPVVTGLSGSYCSAADSQQVKIANLPWSASGIAVEVLLDSTTVLPVKPDSTFAIHPAALSPGRHYLSVTFSYDTVQKRLPLSFNVTPATTPSLDISVNVNPITTDTVPVVITATNVTGGGKQPLYTFAWDRDFIHQLQIESNSNTVTVSPTEFELGDNVIYARLRTSDQCYVSQTGVDSITINKTNITAIVDVDNPGKPVVVYPNPFREQVSINGLQPSKTYIISLYDIQGKLLLHKRVVNQVKAEINPPAVNSGVYILRVYDEKAKKLLGAQKLIGY